MKSILFVFVLLFTLTACDSTYKICKKVCNDYEEGYIPSTTALSAYLNADDTKCKCSKTIYVPVLQPKKVEK